MIIETRVERLLQAKNKKERLKILEEMRYDLPSEIQTDFKTALKFMHGGNPIVKNLIGWRIRHEFIKPSGFIFTDGTCLIIDKKIAPELKKKVIEINGGYSPYPKERKEFWEKVKSSVRPDYTRLIHDFLTCEKRPLKFWGVEIDLEYDLEYRDIKTKVIYEGGGKRYKFADEYIKMFYRYFKNFELRINLGTEVTGVFVNNKLKGLVMPLRDD